MSRRSCASFVARRRRRCSRSLVRSGARNENKNKPLKVQRNGRLSVKYERKQSGEEKPRDSQRATCQERVHVCMRVSECVVSESVSVHLSVKIMAVFQLKKENCCCCLLKRRRQLLFFFMCHFYECEFSRLNSSLSGSRLVSSSHTHTHRQTHRHEPHSHQVDIVSSSSSLLSLARRFHLINCVYKKEMNCHAQQQQQQSSACVCVGVCVSEQRLALIWGCFKSYWLRLSLLHCVRVLGIHECATVCVCFCVCMRAFSSLAFLRARTQFSSSVLPLLTHTQVCLARVCVCVCECARLGLEVSKCNFVCLELFVLLSSCLCLCHCRHLCLRLRLRLCCCFSFSPISFQFLFFSFLLLFAWWVETSHRSLLRPVGLSHSLTPSLSVSVAASRAALGLI